MDLPKKCFAKKAIKDDESVFTDGEVEKIADFIREDPSLLNYGILLAFQTGVRVGELCTLKYSDIQGNKLCIRRTEVRYRDKDGKYVFEVRESPKTEAGNRDIILSSEAKRTLKEIRKLNPFGEYIFMNDGKRIKERSMHKARKTYATKLIKGNQAENEKMPYLQGKWAVCRGFKSPSRY